MPALASPRQSWMSRRRSRKPGSSSWMLGARRRRLWLKRPGRPSRRSVAATPNGSRRKRRCSAKPRLTSPSRRRHREGHAACVPLSDDIKPFYKSRHRHSSIGYRTSAHARMDRITAQSAQGEQRDGPGSGSEITLRGACNNGPILAGRHNVTALARGVSWGNPHGLTVALCYNILDNPDLIGAGGRVLSHESSLAVAQMRVGERRRTGASAVSETLPRLREAIGVFGSFERFPCAKRPSTCRASARRSSRTHPTTFG